MEWQGGNAQLLAMASELHPWRFELEIFPSRLPVDMYLSPNWMLSRVRSVKHFFGNALSRAHRGVLVPTSSSSIHCHLPLSFSGFILKYIKNKNKEKHGKKTPLSIFHCNCSTLARHALKLICHTLSIQFCSSRYWAMRVSCLVVTSRRSRDRNAGFSAADDADARSVVFVFIQINTFTYLRKMSIYQTNSVYVKLYLYSTK